MTGEFELIRRLSCHLAAPGRDLVVGPGDDAAVLHIGGRALCVTVDLIVEGVHFRRDLSSLADIGWKAVAVNVSDLAAMGATPSAGVVGLSRPESLAVAGVERLYEGMEAAAERWGLRLVGGDTVAGPVLTLSVTALGEAAPERVVTRAGARPGDVLVVVGALGAAAAALAQATAGRRPARDLLAAHRRPDALPSAGEALALHGATALIDVSDGLGADLEHICTASGVAARVRWSDLPIAPGVLSAAGELGVDPIALVCGGGEDFALLAALPSGVADEAVAAAARAEDVQAAVVGEVLGPPDAGPAVVLELPAGSTRDLTGLGYEH